ncbi:MAG: agmatinase [Thermoprotei archaeon]|nr:MAG: agmatinase [Thermoprotei archaeon]
MSDILNFYIKSPHVFFNDQSESFENAEFAITGVPMDSTSSFRPGSRFAPYEVRKISNELESYCIEVGIDFDSLKVCDLGDLIIDFKVTATLKRLARVVEELITENKVFTIIGGEHTITLGEVLAASNLYKDFKVLILDAHMDLRDEYPAELKISHATVTRRIGEKIGFKNILILGVRAVSKEEIDFCKKENFNRYLTSETILTNFGIVKNVLTHFLKPKDNVLLSIDIDVLDPAFAPGVSNPEPMGLTPISMMKILRIITSLPINIVGFDVVEVSPPYDVSGITSLIASRIIKNTICYIANKRSKTLKRP